MSKTKSANPAYPGAHPTAPGGMSRADLRLELAEKHGIGMDDTREVRWPDLIDMVIEQRLAREKEGGKPTKKAKDKKTKDKKAKDKKAKRKKGKRVEPDLSEYSEDYIAQDYDWSRVEDFEPEPEPVAKANDRREQELRGMQLPALKAVAREHQMKGYSTLRRADLIAAIMEFEAGATSSTEVSGNDEAAEGGDLFDPETLFEEMAAEFAKAEAEKPPPLFLGIPGIRDYVFDGHAGAGPSSSSRWMSCTMSLSASRAHLETLTPNQLALLAGGSGAARQGTTAHRAAEVKANLMLGRIEQETADATLLDLSTQPPDGEQFDDEMDEYVNEWVDLIDMYAAERGEENILVESRVEAAVPLTGSHEGEVYIIRGSADGIFLPTQDHPWLVVGDLKYGEGIWVDADSNTQAMIYALGALGEMVDAEGNLAHDLEGIRLYIAQPRLGGIKKWEVSLDDLLDWRDDVLSPALTKALYGEDEGATYEPSEAACQFCPARGSCAALVESRLQLATELFDAIQDAEYENGPGAFPETGSLSSERLGALLSQIKPLVKIYEHMKEEAQNRLYRGQPVPGYHLVNHFPGRVWGSGAEEKIKKMRGLSAEQKTALYTEPVIVSPTVAEKVLGKDTYKKKIADLVIKPEPKPVVAPENDRRSAWTGRPPEAMFTNLDEEE